HGTGGLEGHEVKAIVNALNAHQIGAPEDLTAKSLIESISTWIDEPTCPGTVRILAHHLAWDQNQGPRDELSSQLRAAENEAKRLGERSAANKEEIARLTAELEDTRQTRQEARQSLGETREQIARLEEQLGQTREEKEQAAAELATGRYEASEAAQQAEAARQAQAGELAKARQRARTSATWAWVMAGFATAGCLILWLAWLGGHFDKDNPPDDPKAQVLQRQVQQLREQWTTSSNALERVRAELRKTEDRRSEEAAQSQRQINELNDQLMKAREDLKQVADAKDKEIQRVTREWDEIRVKADDLQREANRLKMELDKTPPPPPPPSETIIHRGTNPPVPGRPFTNSLGMRFAPRPGNNNPRILFSIWETRVQDYREFSKEKRAADTERLWETPIWRQQGLPHGPSDAVSLVSWEDARDFAEWLTQRERGLKLLTLNESYRLPTEGEFTNAAAQVLPWDKQFKLLPGSANFGDRSFRGASANSFIAISDQDDGFPWIAPVGSFPKAPIHGLYDLWGNLGEWCSDETNLTTRVARGGSWQSIDLRTLQQSGGRMLLPMKTRSAEIGFRLVLELGPLKAPR
ncbi:MAG: SUMF1/EgtB/PvdO family nonheme iron enzyme, partial [Verrucomicrobiota bacterium]